MISAQQLLSKPDSSEAKQSIKWSSQKSFFAFDNIQLIHFSHAQNIHLTGMLTLKTSSLISSKCVTEQQLTACTFSDMSKCDYVQVYFTMEKNWPNPSVSDYWER